MQLPSEIREAMVGHALRARPLEACGLLAVDGSDTVRWAYCLDNVERSRTSFTVDPDGHFAALTDAEAHGWELGGVFHSHPHGPAVPSPVDLAAGLDPSWIHVIVGLAEPLDPEVRAWRVHGGTASEIQIT
jgi:proteasome lid subunit RPN8/RPN11